LGADRLWRCFFPSEKPSVAQGFIPLQFSETNLVDIPGNSILILGSTCMRAGIGPRRIAEHKIKVLESESFHTDLILGLDFLHKHGATIDWGKGEIVLLGEKLPLYEEHLGSLHGTLNGRQVQSQTHSHTTTSKNHSSLLPTLMDVGIQNDWQSFESSGKTKFRKAWMS